MNTNGKLLLYNGFAFHYEMFGYFIDFCKNNNYAAHVHNKHIDQNWNNYYTETFNDQNFTIKFINEINKTIVNSYDAVVVLTDDDFNYPDDWVNHKTITIDHSYYNRRPIIKNKIAIRQIIDKHLPFAIPVYNILTKDQKINRLTQQNKINICCVGNPNLPDYIKELDFITNNNKNVHFHMINRRMPNFLFNQNHISTYVNIDASKMIDLLLNSHYLLLLDHNKDHVNGRSSSSSIMLGFSAACQLIMPNQMNNCLLNFKSVISYEKDKPLILKYDEKCTDLVFDELRELVKHRDKTIFDILQKINKKILCFYVGFTNLDPKSFYSSDYGLLTVAKLLNNIYDVYIVGFNFSIDHVGGIPYININAYREFQKQNEIEILIVARYIHYFVECVVTANKTYLWAQDNVFLSYMTGASLPDHGKYLVHNILPKITKIIALSDWHKRNLMSVYNLPSDIISVIGYGVDSVSTLSKVKNSFVWSMSPNRGLILMVECFHEIRKSLFDAELNIYCNTSDFDTPELQDLLKNINECSFIHYYDGKDHDEIIMAVQQADFWLYTGTWVETYCLNALEALNAGCVCLVPDFIELQDIICDQGIRLKFQVGSPEFKQECIEQIISIANDAERKLYYQNLASDWSKSKRWTDKLEDWLNLFNE